MCGFLAFVTTLSPPHTLTLGKNQTGQLPKDFCRDQMETVTTFSFGSRHRKDRNVPGGHALNMKRGEREKQSNPRNPLVSGEPVWSVALRSSIEGASCTEAPTAHVIYVTGQCRGGLKGLGGLEPGCILRMFPEEGIHEKCA